jgi:sugar/nucleoside kinase (ribokinase family)
MAKPKVITLGGATWDAILAADNSRVLEADEKQWLAYPYGEKLHLSGAHVGFGGGAANVAVGLSRLGIPTEFVGAIGDTYLGEAIKDNFNQNRVITNQLQVIKDTTSGMSIVLTAPDGERTVLLNRGANDHLDPKKIDWQTLADADWWHVSSLSGEAGTIYDELADRATHAKVKLSLNPGATQVARGAEGLHAALKQASLVIVNQEEAAQLLGPDSPADDRNALATTLQGISGGTAVVTSGKSGASFTDGTDCFSLDAPSPERVNTLGAGDAFSSGMLAALIKGRSLEDAGRFASLNASAVVAEYDAQRGLLAWDTLSERAEHRTDFTAAKV